MLYSIFRVLCSQNADVCKEGSSPYPNHMKYNSMRSSLTVWHKLFIYEGKQIAKPLKP